MDLTGKTFRSENTIVYVQGPSKRNVYNVIVFSKEKSGYNLGYHVMRDIVITYLFYIEIDSDVVLKAKAMFELNYIACRSLAKNAKVVKSSKHIIHIGGAGVLLWGSYNVTIYKYYIRIQPIQCVSDYYGLGEHIIKKDYNKIFHKIKQLKKDFDKLWADVV